MVIKFNILGYQVASIEVDISATYKPAPPKLVDKAAKWVSRTWVRHMTA